MNDKKKRETLSRTEMYEDILKECIDSYIKESIKHFLKDKRLYFEDNGRYFYTKKELLNFVNGYEKKGGDLNTLYCEKLYENNEYINKNSEFLCYAVYHMRYYERVHEKIVKPSLFKTDEFTKIIEEAMNI